MFWCSKQTVLTKVPEGDWSCPSCSSISVPELDVECEESDDVECGECRRKDGADKMLLCDGEFCKRGWHLHCLPVPLSEVPYGD